MGKVIFAKDAENQKGSMIAFAADSVDLAAKNYSSSHYKIIDITDDELNNLRLEKKRCWYDSNGIVWADLVHQDFSSEADLQAMVDGLPQGENTAHNSCVTSFQSKSFDDLTYPLSKTLAEVAEDKGITWVAHNQLT